MTSANTQTDGVRERFSRAGVAGKWYDMYESDTAKLEEDSFRLRRDFTVARIAAAVKPGARVLDLGCGTGPVLAQLRRRGIDCIGMDYSPDMLALARARLHGMDLDSSGLFIGDCRATPFADASFDAIVCL